MAGEHGGVFPDTEAGLSALPGVGAYTAAAVAAIAFDRPANVVDGNVERVMARLFAVETPVPQARPELRRLAGLFVQTNRCQGAGNPSTPSGARSDRLKWIPAREVGTSNCFTSFTNSPLRTRLVTKSKLGD